MKELKDYQKRFVKEYDECIDRMWKLDEHINATTDLCDFKLCHDQYNAMQTYLSALHSRIGSVLGDQIAKGFEHDITSNQKHIINYRLFDWLEDHGYTTNPLHALDKNDIWAPLYNDGYDLAKESLNDSQPKNLKMVPNTKIYLATSYFNEEQKTRLSEALTALKQNDTVGVIHQPFDFQYKDAKIDDDPEGIFGSLEWQLATYNNDVNAIGNSDVCVALYDMDEPDEGICFEIGMFVAMHKPVILLPFTSADTDPHLDYGINLMLARGVTTWLIPNDMRQLEDFNFNHPMAQPVPPFEVF